MTALSHVGLWLPTSPGYRGGGRKSSPLLLEALSSQILLLEKHKMPLALPALFMMGSEHSPSLPHSPHQSLKCLPGR